uniref:DOT1 domain-containing protein n=1 Tax=Haptolina ericina TaxID=156174 RepID=A0A7S3BPB9_9EUKA|mmetsp:Transcript_64059/g.143160  ORF Transcript_64059/g.143160 Transcript_64059/m.143160 type:complete len:218 (+) Transcript_64059:688-1341(+)
MWGEENRSRPVGPKTARTSEGYGEATCSTAEKLIGLLSNLTCFVPAMAGWDDVWNLNEDASFLDIGSGYGKVIFHVKLLTGCRRVTGIECVAKRAEISTLAHQGLYGELDRSRLDDDLLQGVSFEAADATEASEFTHSHIYLFDRVFSHITLEAIAKVLQRSPFYVMVSSKGPSVWWGVGLSKVQPVAKMRFVTTGRERCTVYIYINAHFIPGTLGI